MWWLRRSISTTSASACRSACAAASPAKPPPTITIRDFCRAPCAAGLACSCSSSSGGAPVVSANRTRETASFMFRHLLFSTSLEIAVILPEFLLVELPHTCLRQRFNKQNLVWYSVFRNHAGISEGVQMRLYLRVAEIIACLRVPDDQ